MTERKNSGCWARLFVTLPILGIALTGCAILGPSSIKYGRPAYNDAIIATNSQQVLAMIVRMRYGEPSGLLAVSSVTANLHFQGSLGSEFGIGPDSNYEGNLTPLSAGVAYEENPTISYVPVQGEKYLRQFMSPLPIDLTVLLLGALGDSTNTATLICKSINGIRNPAYLVGASIAPDPRFERVVELLTELHRGGRTTWVEVEGEHPTYALALRGQGAVYEQQLDELYKLLGFTAPRDLDRVISLPVRLSIGRPRQPTIQLATASLYDLFRMAAASVEVPDEHVESGLAPQLPPTAAAERNIHVRGSKSRPGRAMTAVKHHGWWYSIDATDSSSKMTFRILEALMSVRMAETVKGRAAPILTVPVSQ